MDTHAAPGRIDCGELVLRRWRASDLDAFASLSADLEVMACYLRPMKRAEAQAMLERIEAGFEARGFGLWAVELPGEADCVGYAGLSVPGFDAAFQPCIEVGWRLARAHWGRGIATRAARAAIEDGRARLGIERIVSFTAAVNLRSRRVMERLGMERDPGFDFLHPGIPEGQRLRPHVLYRLDLARTGDPVSAGRPRNRA